MAATASFSAEVMFLIVPAKLVSALQGIISQVIVQQVQVPSYGTMNACYGTRNINFFGVAQTVPAMFRWSTKYITSPEETDFGVLALMNDLVDEALGTNKLYRGGNRTKINGNGIMRYGLEQSTRDLNHTECNNCLKILVNNVSDCCQSSSGFRMFNPSCDLRYEIYPFFEQLQALPPPSSQPLPPLQSLLPRSGNAKIVDFFFHPQKKKAWQFYLNILALLKFRQTKEYVTVSIFLQWNF